MMDIGHWSFPHEFNIEDWFGFIYRITEKHTGKEYVGKKQFFSHRSKIVKGKKNRKHYKKESDWKKYTGSSKELNIAIEQHGKENYHFKIESLHKTRGSLFYEEVYIQITEDVLRAKLPNNTRKYYNGHISSVKFLPPDKTQEELKFKHQ